MNMQTTFNNPEEKPFVFNNDGHSNEALPDNQKTNESQWCRVLSVIVVEGEMRYLVERPQ